MAVMAAPPLGETALARQVFLGPPPSSPVPAASIFAGLRAGVGEAIRLPLGTDPPPDSGQSSDPARHPGPAGPALSPTAEHSLRGRGPVPLRRPPPTGPLPPRNACPARVHLILLRLASPL